MGNGQVKQEREGSLAAALEAWGRDEVRTEPQRRWSRGSVPQRQQERWGTQGQVAQAGGGSTEQNQ